MRFHLLIVLPILMCLVGVFGGARVQAQEQQPIRALSLPVALPAGPNTWLLGQPYGNTTGAYYNGDAWYRAGQRLHFGIDLSMPCGTPLVAVADAEVIGVSDLNFGSAPHNLILRHNELNLVTLYGHLLERPNLVNGQFVRRGDVVGYSGDPDLTCDSRPHLHFEVRSLNFRTAYNPVDYIDANWDMLATIGSFSAQSFQRDLDNPRRWLTLYDQPDVAFGGAALNNYAAVWPPDGISAENTALPRSPLPAPAANSWQSRRLGYEGCCFTPLWHPTLADRLYTIDGGEGQRAGIYEWVVGSDSFNMIDQTPPPLWSPDGTHEIRRTADGQTLIRRPADGAEWLVDTSGMYPAVNTDNTRLLWQFAPARAVPGETAPPLEIWISDIDGANRTLLASIPSGRGGAQWLDTTRLLISYRERQTTTLAVFDLRDNRLFSLGAWERMRGLSVAPGGGRLMFYLTFQNDPAAAGIYVIDTREGAIAQKIEWFGAWRWRDADSVYYIPFDAATNFQQLAYYHIPSGETVPLTEPARTTLVVANGDWSVSADGRRIAFLNALDLTMWLLEENSG
jgi:murein DD-endopeptidase MepM/ murein hydrolase activator NlpD